MNAGQTTNPSTLVFLALLALVAAAGVLFAVLRSDDLGRPLFVVLTLAGIVVAAGALGALVKSLSSDVRG